MPNKKMNDFEKYWSCRNMLKFMANIAACEYYNFDDKNNITEKDGIREYEYDTQDAANTLSSMSLAILNHLNKMDGEKCFPPDAGVDEIEIPKDLDKPPRGTKPRPMDGFVKRFMDVPYSDN